MLSDLLYCKGTWELSSAGRASALQAEGHRFEPYSSHQDPPDLTRKVRSGFSFVKHVAKRRVFALYGAFAAVTQALLRYDNKTSCAVYFETVDGVNKYDFKSVRSFAVGQHLLKRRTVAVRSRHSLVYKSAPKSAKR